MGDPHAIAWDPRHSGVGLGLTAAVGTTGAVDTTSLAAVVKSAEMAGMAGIWVPENLLAPHDTLDPLVLLAWVAAHTESIAVGTAVLLLPHQHLYRLAQRLASLDQLSSGRLVVGIGSGAKGPARDLLADDSYNPATEYESDIAVLRGLLRGERVMAERPRWPAEGIRLEVLPVAPGGPPFWIGGSAAPALDRIARVGEGWIASGSAGMADFAGQHRYLEDSIARAGRSQDDLAVAKRVYLYLGDDESATRAMETWFRESWGDPELASRAGVSGSPGQCAEEIHALRSAGADLIILDPVGELAAQTDRIISELLPLL